MLVVLFVQQMKMMHVSFTHHLKLVISIMIQKGGILLTEIIISAINIAMAVGQETLRISSLPILVLLMILLKKELLLCHHLMPDKP